MDTIPAVLATERRRFADVIPLCATARQAPAVLELRSIDWALVTADDDRVVFELDGETFAFDTTELRTYLGASA